MTPAEVEECRAVDALLRYAERHPAGEQRTDPPLELDLDDEDLFGLLVAAEHGVEAARISAYRSLARSRGLTLEQVLRAAFRGELREVVELPPVPRAKVG